MTCDINLFWNGLTAISTFLSLIAAAAIYILARKELIKNNQISELDIYFKIKADLNSELSQLVYKAVLEGHLKFVRRQDGLIHFMIMNSDYQWVSFPMSDVDLGFLAHLEDLAMAYEKGLISLEIIKSGYSTLILTAGNAPCIYEYITYLRNEKFNDKDLYSGFEQLYLKLYEDLSAELKAKYRPELCLSK